MNNIIKQEGLYQGKVNSSLVSSCNCKMGFWTYQLLSKFQPRPQGFYTKRFVVVSQKNQKKTQYFLEENYYIINAFILNKIDFQNCFLLILTLKLRMYEY